MDKETIILNELIMRQQNLSIDPKEAKIETAPSPVLVGGTTQVNVSEMDARNIERLLYLHPVIPRGIEIKANRMVSRGYTIKGKHAEAVAYCKDLMKESGGIIFLKKLIENTYAFGNGWAELIGTKNKKDNRILKVQLLHPVYFGFYKEKSDEGENLVIVFDKTTKQPVGMCEYAVKDDVLQPKAQDNGKVKILPPSTIAHLTFDTWGDEIEGISLIRYVITVLNYLLNIEQAAAQAAFLTGNPRYKFNTEITSKDALIEFAKNVDKINERDSIIMTKGNDVNVLSPGNGLFEGYHDKFMNLLTIRLGIPKPFLMLDGTCYTEDTETLTQDGWKFWYDIKDTDEIAVYNKDTNIIQYEKPTDMQLYKHDGDTYEFDNKCTNVKVTPNHKMLWRTYSDKSEYKKTRADEIDTEYLIFKTNGNFVDVEEQSDYFIPSYKSKMYDVPEQNLPYKEMIKFLGWYFSEGCSVYGQVRITQNEGKNADEIRGILKNLKFDYYEYLDKRDNKSITFKIKNVGLAKYLSIFGKRSFNKYLPIEITSKANTEAIKLFLDTFRKGDGSLYDNGHVEYYSSSKKMIDQLQILNFKLGLKTGIRKIIDKRYNGCQEMYTLSIHKNLKGETVLNKADHVTKEHYSGMIYCFETSTGYFVTRRNGKIAIQGNSTNKSTTDVQEQFMREESVAEEAMVEMTIERQIFENALKVKFGDEFLTENIPSFSFNKYAAARESLIDKLDTRTTAINKIIDAAKKLEDMGRTDLVEKVLAMMPLDIDMEDKDEGNEEKTDEGEEVVDETATESVEDTDESATEDTTKDVEGDAT